MGGALAKRSPRAHLAATCTQHSVSESNKVVSVAAVFPWVLEGRARGSSPFTGRKLRAADAAAAATLPATIRSRSQGVRPDVGRGRGSRLPPWSESPWPLGLAKAEASLTKQRGGVEDRT